jgi:hypothetical protein
MSNDEKLKPKKSENIYDILRRLGFKLIGRDAGRPNFQDSKTAKTFFWKTHKEVYQPFKDGRIGLAAARAKTISIVNEFGPQLWGIDRSNLVSAHENNAYPKDLHWNENEETRELYVHSFVVFI